MSFGILNKASGFYGLASILTGKRISAMEWILNIWSLVLLSVFIMAFLGVRNRRALTVLAFAHFYVVDTLFIIAFTIFFCVKWFKTHQVSDMADVASSAISRQVREIATATAATATSTAIPSNSSTTVMLAAGADFSDSASLGQETAVSIILTVFVLLARIYFTFIIIGFARQLVRQHNLRRYNGTPRGSWKATLQSWLLGPMESFWTGFTSSSSSSFSPLMSHRHHGPSDSVASDAMLLSDHKKFDYEDEEYIKDNRDDLMPSPSGSHHSGFRLASASSSTPAGTSFRDDDEDQR